MNDSVCCGKDVDHTNLHDSLGTYKNSDRHELQICPTDTSYYVSRPTDMSHLPTTKHKIRGATCSGRVVVHGDYYYVTCKSPGPKRLFRFVFDGDSSY
eukprot:scaffold14060_cov83-Cylindrotheca_fusiformis.AAC.1